MPLRITVRLALFGGVCLLIGCADRPATPAPTLAPPAKIVRHVKSLATPPPQR